MDSSFYIRALMSIHDAKDPIYHWKSHYQRGAGSCQLKVSNMAWSWYQFMMTLTSRKLHKDIFRFKYIKKTKELMILNNHQVIMTLTSRQLHRDIFILKYIERKELMLLIIISKEVYVFGNYLKSRLCWNVKRTGDDLAT